MSLTTEQCKAIEKQSYVKNGIQIHTIPLSEKAGGCLVKHEGDLMLFVNSKKTRAERSAIIRELSEKRHSVAVEFADLPKS